MKPLRWCWYALIAPDSQGLHRIVLVIENVGGYLRRAEGQASDFNRALGVSEEEATHIVFSSLRATHQKGKD